METIEFSGYEIEVRRKSRRRSFVLTMHPDRPPRLGVSQGTPRAEMLRFLESKKRWIDRTSEKFRSLHTRFPAPRMREGEKFPFRGELKYLQFAAGRGRKISFAAEDGFLICYAPAGGELREEDFFAGLRKFYRREAAIFLTERVRHWAEETGLRPARLFFRSTQTRWGSCSSARHVSLNWKLICQAPALIDYVIVHELCHLRHLNHSADFWNLVETYLPSYREVEAVLHDQERLGAFLR